MAMAFKGHSPNGHNSQVKLKDGNTNNLTLSNILVIEYNNDKRPSKKTKTSKYPGVSWNNDTKKWHSQITENYRTKHLGFYNTEEEAHKSFQDHLLQSRNKIKFQ